VVDDSGIQRLISINGHSFMAIVKEKECEILLLASEDVADLDYEVGETPLAEYFSRFVPHAMALRYLAGDACWRPANRSASVVIDDPILRKSYGFLDFDFLLRQTREHNFHAAIAFIPHNYRRSSSRTTRLFRDNPERLSICFHGNDHTQAEFASTTPSFLNLLLRIADGRMAKHESMTGLACDRVMVFPQGKFSVEAMKALQRCNFFAAVNTVAFPVGSPLHLSIGELAQPAVFRYGGFPLFLRRSVQKIRDEDVAFNVFFGRPVLMVEHHGDFEDPEELIELIGRINAIAPGINWGSLATVTRCSFLTRRSEDGTQVIRAYAASVHVANETRTRQRYLIEWMGAHDVSAIEQVLVDGSPRGHECCDDGLRMTTELDPGKAQTLSVDHCSSDLSAAQLDLKWKTKALLRRRLSEFRDHYLSRNPNVLRAAKALQRRVSNL
jgi:hypothetical protein